MEKPRPFNGRVIFDHLPKTGGQAVKAWLTNTLGTGTVTTNLIGEHRALIRRYGGAYAVISGHEEDSPNVDSVVWFVNEVLPLIDKLTMSMPRVVLVGRTKATRMKALQSPRVIIVGEMEDVRHRWGNGGCASLV